MERERRGGLVGPIILIAAGLLFLLSNLGVVDWSIWRSVLSLWPIILIGIGLDLLVGRRSSLGSFVVALLVLALLLGGVWYLAAGTSFTGEMATYAISQPLQDATQAQVEIKAGAGTLNFGPLAASDHLVAGEVKLRSNQRLDEKARTSGDTAIYQLTTSGPNFFLAPTVGKKAIEQWDLQLNPAIPTDLDIGTGVGDARVDLSRMSLTSLTLGVGVGNANIILPERGRLEVDVSGGIGKLTLRLPGGMAARVDAGSGIGKVDVRGDFKRRGEIYQSPDYETAADRIDMKIHAGIGNIVVEPYQGE